jgi:hypothetical protein
MVAVHANATITATGGYSITGLCARSAVYLTVNLKAAPTGTTPTLTYSISEVDPGDQTTVIGTPVTGAALSAAGTQQIALTNTTTGCVRITWTITGAGASFGQVYSTLTTKRA